MTRDACGWPIYRLAELCTTLSLLPDIAVNKRPLHIHTLQSYKYKTLVCLPAKSLNQLYKSLLEPLDHAIMHLVLSPHRFTVMGSVYCL